jgi:hypothetical protein
VNVTNSRFFQIHGNLFAGGQEKPDFSERGNIFIRGDPNDVKTVFRQDMFMVSNQLTDSPFAFWADDDDSLGNVIS